MSWHIGVHIGESFAEVVAQSHQSDSLKGGSLPIQKRWYLPSENLTIGLQNFWKSLPAIESEEPAKIVVTSRLPEKILGRKLGGTVALLFTGGLEEWSYLRQPLKYDGFELVPERQVHLANSDAVFGITERINAKGEVLEAPPEAELEFIASKLKMMNIERVCVNFLFSKINPAHEKNVGDYFTEKGFKVFLSHACNDTDHEILRWRLNTLNACLSGVFEETKLEIEKSLENTPFKAEILFQSSCGHRFAEDANLITSSVFGHLASLGVWSKKKIKAPDFCILHLGLEQFALVNPNKTSHQWKSPWGPVSLDAPDFTNLQIQPTQEISTGPWLCLDFTSKDLGYEPGPMCMGRALRPTLLDLLYVENENFAVEGLKYVSQTTGREKIASTLSTLGRHASRQEHRGEDLIKTLITHAVYLMVQDLLLFSPHKKVFVTGALAPLLVPHFKKQGKQFEYILSEPYDFCESSSLTDEGALT